MSGAVPDLRGQDGRVRPVAQQARYGEAETHELREGSGLHFREGLKVHPIGKDLADVECGEEREEYVKYAPWKGEKEGESSLSAERMADLADREQFILTVCANGYGKMSSAYEYRRTGRGGQGITNIDNIARNGLVVASFAATKADQLMLVTDQAKLIRLPLGSMRVIGRNSAGVRLFNVADEEHVVSAVRLADTGDEDEADAADGAPESGPADAGDTAE